MTTLHLFQDHPFDAIATKVMVLAFEQACVALGEFGRMANIQKDLAKQIVEVAKTGERDPHRIQEHALKALYTPKQIKAEVIPRQPPLRSRA